MRHWPDIPAAVLRLAAAAGAERCSWMIHGAVIIVPGPRPAGSPRASRLRTGRAVYFWDRLLREVGEWSAARPEEFIPNPARPSLCDLVATTHAFAPMPGPPARPRDLASPCPLPHEVEWLGCARAAAFAPVRANTVRSVMRRRIAGLPRAAVRAWVVEDLRSAFERTPCKCPFCYETAAAVALRTFDLIWPDDPEETP